MGTRLLFATAIALTLAGCPSPSEPALDAGAPRDGGSDALAPDAPALDAAGLDAAADPDGSTTDDAGPTDDGGGAGDDAGMADAGMADAGMADAGSPTDAGPVTTCSIDASPPSVAVSGMLTFTGASNGTGCTARIDGTLTMTIPCTASMSVPATAFGVGMHTVELLVGDGPSGATSCSDTFTVTADPATTCTLDVSPPSGMPTDAFTITGTSDGSGCTLQIDGGALMTVPCASTTTRLGSDFGAGTHTVVLRVASGPGGATSCARDFTVGAPTTTCTMDVTPSSGTPDDTFTATWRSNGTTCELWVNGVMFGGAMSCTNVLSAPGSVLGPGTHTIELRVLAGPSGPTTCSDMATVTP